MGVTTTATLDRTLICEPIFKSAIWGGRRLEMLGKNLPPSEKISESWEIADIEEGTSSICNIDGGMSLSEAMSRFGGQLAPHHEGERYPLLVKFLDVHQDTSIQVHPDAETCRRFFPNEKPKTETWVVMHAEPGASLLHDLKPNCSQAKFAWHVQNGNVRECLREVAVEAGNVIHVPAGTVHALQAGIMVLEIQEPSDSTFRIDDQGRVGEDGQPRELHIEEALKATKITHDSPDLVWPEVDRFEWGACELLVDCGPYRMNRLTIDGSMSWNLGPDRSFAATITAGDLEVQSAGWSGRLSRGTSVLVPAGIGKVSIQSRVPSTIIIAEAHA